MRNPADMRIEPQNTRSGAVAIPDALLLVGSLAGVQPYVVSVIAAVVIHFRFPLHIGAWAKLADLEFRCVISAETTDGPVHDVTGDALFAVEKIRVPLLVKRTVIDRSAAKVRIIQALVHIGHLIGVVDERG